MVFPGIDSRPKFIFGIKRDQRFIKPIRFIQYQVWDAIILTIPDLLAMPGKMDNYNISWKSRFQDFFMKSINDSCFGGLFVPDDDDVIKTLEF